MFTPTYDFLEPYGDFTFSADFIEIMLTDYVTRFGLIDFMEACYDAASFKIISVITSNVIQLLDK